MFTPFMMHMRRQAEAITTADEARRNGRLRVDEYDPVAEPLNFVADAGRRVLEKFLPSRRPLSHRMICDVEVMTCVVDFPLADARQNEAVRLALQLGIAVQHLTVDLKRGTQPIGFHMGGPNSEEDQSRFKEFVSHITSLPRRSSRRR